MYDRTLPQSRCSRDSPLREGAEGGALRSRFTVYAGASILGRITIGKGSIIGGNVWLTHSVPEGSRIVQSAGKAKPGEVLTGNKDK